MHEREIDVAQVSVEYLHNFEIEPVKFRGDKLSMRFSFEQWDD